MVSRLELQHRRFCRPGELIAPEALAVAKGVQVGVEGGHVGPRRHPGHEGPPRGHVAVQQDARLAVDGEQLLAPADDLPDLGEVGVSRAPGAARCADGRVGLVVGQLGLVLRKGHAGRVHLRFGLL